MTNQSSITAEPQAAEIVTADARRSAPNEAWGLAALEQRRQRTAQHLARLAERREYWIDQNRYYYGLLTRLLRFLTEPNKRVLFVRSGPANLLASVTPGDGVGVEICQAMIDVAQRLHPEFNYKLAFPDTDELLRSFPDPKPIFDYIVFSEIDDTVDIQRGLQNLRGFCARHTRLIIITYNKLWEPLVEVAELFGMKVPRIEQNWLSEADVQGLLTLGGFDVLGSRRIVLCPKYIPLLSAFLNGFVARLPGFNRLCMTEVHVARIKPTPIERKKLTVSVVIPCKDERGNIEEAVRRIPELAGKTEIIFCDDKSTDGTPEKVREMQALHPDRNIRLEFGPGVCKSRNVWTGFDAASGDILAILDADLTTMPEELPHFIEAMASGIAEFVNGSRLIYPVPRAAMKGLNMLGNKFFSLAFSYLLNQRVKDTLCGTKVLWRSDWERIKPLRGSWGIEDRWGDYELLFGASKLNLRILDLPVHYQERIYGTTKMTRVFHNGIIMLKMCWHGFLKLKLS
jgi:Glycosyl transferase family 2